MLKQVAAATVLIAAATAASAQSYTVEPRHTSVTWSVNHLGTSTYRGKLNKTSGKVVLDSAARTGSVDITIDALGLFSGDPQLDKHMSGEDFFNVAKFTTATFKSTKVEFNGAAPSKIEGNLTLLGITKPVTLTVTAFNCKMHPAFKKDFCGADATATIKRTDWGMKYAVPNVSDDVKLDVQIEALKD
jgi:polyisoprenoid-binding protein YceI